MTALPSPSTRTQAVRIAGRRRQPLGARGALITIVVVVVLLLGWQIGVTASSIPVTVLPSPAEIVLQADWGAVFAAAGATILATLAGFVVGNIVGLVLAISVTASRTLSDIVYPFAVLVRSIPIVALAPFIILVFGRGPAATTVVAALIVFFPTLVNVILGLRSVPQEANELMKVVNATRVFQYAHMRIPFAMPAFISALKISAPNAVLGVMTAEWIIGGNGLGRLIIQSWLTLNVPTMWGAVVLSAIVAWLLFSVVTLIERTLLGWAVRT